MGKSGRSKGFKSRLCPKPQNLRRLRAADLLGAMRVERECFKGVDRWKLKSYLRLLEEGGTAFVVGFPVRAVIWVAPLDKMTAEVVSLATRPRYCRRGYADMLMEYAIAHMREGHYSRVVLEARASNKGAIRLYERHGFKKVKLEENYYKDEDALKMRLCLSSRRR